MAFPETSSCSCLFLQVKVEKQESSESTQCFRVPVGALSDDGAFQLSYAGLEGVSRCSSPGSRSVSPAQVGGGRGGQLQTRVIWQKRPPFLMLSELAVGHLVRDSLVLIIKSPSLLVDSLCWLRQVLGPT